MQLLSWLLGSLLLPYLNFPENDVCVFSKACLSGPLFSSPPQCFLVLYDLVVLLPGLE